MRPFCMSKQINVSLFLNPSTLDSFSLEILLAETIGGMEVSRYIVLALIILLFLILGCFIESIPMIIIVVPVVLPVILSFGFDPVWFGVISVLMVEAALITPPVGLNVYVISGVARHIAVMEIFRSALPFLLSMIAVVIILAAYPPIALFLPSLIK